MAPEPSTDGPPSSLTATYSSPNTSQTFSHPLPQANTSSTAEKTTYLAALRTSVTKLQDEVNVFLTAKMEEDKKAGEKVDDKREEDNYGEDGVEEG